jgi:hypothetical protein
MASVEEALIDQDNGWNPEVFQLACETVFALFCFNCRFLTLVITEEIVTECMEYGKHFICLLTKLQLLVGYTLEETSYLTTGNVVCSLLIPPMLARRGTFRFFWDLIDEKAVQKIKGVLSNINMTSDTWLAAILELVTKFQTLRMVSDDFQLDVDEQEDEAPDGTEGTKPRYNKFRIPLLSNLDEFGTRPFNCLWLDDEFVAPFRVDGTRKQALYLIPLVVMETPKWIRNVPFCTFTFDPESKIAIEEHAFIVQYKQATACACLTRIDALHPEHLGKVVILHPDHKWWTGSTFELPALRTG